MSLLRQLYWRWWCFWNRVCFRHGCRKRCGYTTSWCPRCAEERQCKSLKKVRQFEAKLDQFRRESEL